MTLNPCDQLTVPTAEEPKNIVDDILHIPDFLNASYWFADLCEAKFHIDPFKEAGKAFAGHWDKIQQAGNATKNVAAFNRSYGDAIRQHINKLTTDGLVRPQHNGGTGWEMVPSDAKWSGHAAQAAKVYFNVFASRMNQQAAAMDSIGKKIDDLAEAVYSGAHLLETLLQSAFDKLFDYAVAALAAGLVPGGPIVSLVILAKSAYDSIRAVMDQIGKVQMAVDAAIVLITNELSGADANSLQLVSLAKDHYYHPGVDHHVNL